MKRVKKHSVKKEIPETSGSHTREEQDHDLAYYIHDRVELMHQVFSILKMKELKAMAPHFVKDTSISDLQELCTEELLGISSKRLCAILDGAEPPSDTDSSSPSPTPEQETISLDSISSDEEILSQSSSKKKKHKHRRERKSRRERRRSGSPGGAGGAAGSAGGAGLTVLELLELQARARAIRAQLQQDRPDNQKSETAAASSIPSSDDEVQIKEEPPEVLEISSDDDKPDVAALQQAMNTSANKQCTVAPPQTVTKRVNDLVITVPQAQTTRKIKLNRTKSIPNAEKKQDSATVSQVPKQAKNVAEKTAKKKQKKKRKKDVAIEKDSDNDELMLQLSDTEKMDLLEDLEGKESSVDSESSSSDSDEEPRGKTVELNKPASVNEKNDAKVIEKDVVAATNIQGKDTEVISIDNEQKHQEESSKTGVKESDRTNASEQDKDSDENTRENEKAIDEKNETSNEEVAIKNTVLKETEKAIVENKVTKENHQSDGEVTEKTASDAEAVNTQTEVVCISDEDEKQSKKKKKKDKKSKKEKKSKKTKDFRERADDNFYTQNKEHLENNEDNVLEILELSDSSCYEVEGAILSKEPTAEEIEALSAKIDEIEREEVITDEQIKEHESRMSEISNETDPERISWKERYLLSSKVRKVMTTSNIFNAMRKKNKELKKKMEDSKLKTTEDVEKAPIEMVGTIEEFNTLQGSTKYVDPVPEPSTETEKSGEAKVTGEMKKDAKQLMKMYKMLLKYNDVTEVTDSNRKKKKKQKKSKEKSQDGVANVAT